MAIHEGGHEGEGEVKVMARVLVRAVYGQPLFAIDAEGLSAEVVDALAEAPGCLALRVALALARSRAVMVPEAALRRCGVSGDEARRERLPMLIVVDTASVKDFLMEAEKKLGRILELVNAP